MLPLAAAAIFCAALVAAPSANLLNADPPERDDTVVPSHVRLAAYEHLLHNTPNVAEDPSVAERRSDWDANHYQLTLVPDFEEGSLTGYVEITFTTLRFGLANIQLDLQDNLTVFRVFDSVGNLGFNHHDDVLDIRLSSAMSPGEKQTVSVHYEGRPQPAGALGFSFDTTPAGNPILATVSEPFYARSWWPCKDTVLDKATVDVLAIVPEGMFAAAAGELVSESGSDGSRLFRWSSSYPMTTYNVSVAITDYASWSEEYVSPEGDEFPLDFYVFPEHESIARYEFERVAQMLDFFSERYGPYPFDREKYGMAEVVLAGAMEHQTMTSYGDFFMTGDRYYEGIVAHELSHHWWGNLLTLTDWNDLWLHEAMATFSDGLWREHVDGRAAYLQFLRQRSASCCGFYGPISPPSRLFNQTVYQKGAWMLHMLREWLGDEVFFSALRSITSDPALRYAHITPRDFIDACESTSGQDLDWFFDQWLNLEGRPELDVNWIREKTGQNDQYVRLHVKQVQEAPAWKIPVRVRVEFPSGAVDHDIFMDESMAELRFPVTEWPTAIQLDPDQQLLFFDRGVEEGEPVSPKPYSPQISLSASPNPFNPRTAISFALAEGAPVSLRIYDVRGRSVRTEDFGWLDSGEHQMVWTGTDDAGRAVASGTYFVKLVGTGADLPALRITLVR